MDKPHSPAAMPAFLGAGRFDGDWKVRVHTHRGVEFVLVEKGCCTVDIDGQEMAGPPGTLYIFPAGTRHNQRCNGMVRTIFCIFTATPSPGYDCVRTIQFNGDDFLWIRACMDLILKTSGHLPDQAQQTVAGLLHSCISFVAHAECRIGASATLHSALSRAVSFIDTHITDSLSIHAIARNAAISPSYLTALFHQHLHTSPLQYLLRGRMKHACHLLRNPYLGIKEIAYQCGFEDPNYFSRQFARMHGFSPREFRQNKQQ